MSQYSSNGGRVRRTLTPTAMPAHSPRALSACISMSSLGVRHSSAPFCLQPIAAASDLWPAASTKTAAAPAALSCCRQRTAVAMVTVASVNCHSRQQQQQQRLVHSAACSWILAPVATRTSSSAGADRRSVCYAACSSARSSIRPRCHGAALPRRLLVRGSPVANPAVGRDGIQRVMWTRAPVVVSMASGSSADLPSYGASTTFAGSSCRLAGKGGRRSSASGSAAPVPTASGAAATGGSCAGTPITSGTAPSAASSPAPAPHSGAVGSPSGAAVGGGKGVMASAAHVSASSAAVAITTRSLEVNDTDYEAVATGSSNAVGGNIVPFVRRQPRALVLDCAYRPINVLTWYKAFHFDYFGKGEVLEYYSPPAVCTTGSGDHPLPAVLRVPQYTADMQDLCSRVACTRRNIMVRDGFCCQYCGSRRDLTLDHVHPVSKGGKETWENLELQITRISAVTACMRCNQKKSDRTLRELGWKLRRQPKEPTPYEIGIVAGVSTSDILRPPPEWEAYIAPYRERLETYRRAAVEAGLVNLMEDD